MYTLDTLLADCVGRYVTTSGGKVQLSNLLSARVYADSWGALMAWAARQFAQGATFSLAPLGVVTQSDSGGASKSPQAAPKRVTATPPIFSFVTSFCLQFKLSPKACPMIADVRLRWIFDRHSWMFHVFLHKCVCGAIAGGYFCRAHDTLGFGQNGAGSGCRNVETGPVAHFSTARRTHSK